MNRRTYLKSSLAVGGSLLIPPSVLALAGCSGTARVPELASIDGQIMGTSYSVRFDAAGDKSLSAAIHTALQDVDAHMSTWRASSELTQFNNSTHGDWQPLTAATTQVVAHALETSRASKGAFDVTVGPLVDLWGFGGGSEESSRNGTRPARSDISQTLAAVGHEAIEVDVTANAIRKQNSASRLDLSGIAKGHAVDQIAAVMNAHGIENYLAEVGGELKARGLKPDGSQWRVAIERPDAGKRDVYRVINLQDRAIATSGDYRNFFSDDAGKLYSHSIDPRTGQPVSHELASVSVLAESTMAADALSTALMIMGPDDAMTFANQHQIAAHVILKSGKALEEHFSSTFESFVA